jgi:hypothetical protein
VADKTKALRPLLLNHETKTLETCNLKPITMKTFKIDSWGNIPNFLIRILDYQVKPASRDYISCLDSDISFFVIDCKECHGNLNKADKTAWLSPRNGDNSWNININWK